MLASMTTSGELHRLERQLLEAEAALDRARAENGLAPVSSPASADDAWRRMLADAERMVQAKNPSQTAITAQLIVDASRVRRGEVVDMEEAVRQRLSADKGKRK
jgi:hypothetical protein